MRVFAGLPLPPEAALAVERWTADWRARVSGLAWVAPSLLHISLHFFGEIADEQADALADDLGLMGAAAIAARTGDIGCFPPGPRTAPRVLFLGLERGAAGVCAVQAAYAARIAALGFEPEARPFVPHLTLARVRSLRHPSGPRGDVRERDRGQGREGDAREGDRGGAGAADIRGLAGGPGLDLVFDRLVLFESVLRPQGPLYRPLRTLTLERAA